VFCVAADGEARLFLQKPSLAEQERQGAINDRGQSVLDIGAMSFDAATAMTLFRAFDVLPDHRGPRFSEEMEKTRPGSRPRSLPRDLLCPGQRSNPGTPSRRLRGQRINLVAGPTRQGFGILSRIRLSAVVLPHCEFLHFGTTRQLITSGLDVLRHDGQPVGPDTHISLNNCLAGEGRICGGESWVEGCRIAAPLTLAGQNVVVGVDIDEPLELPQGACLDVIAGETRAGREAWFVRAYHVGDTFKDTLARGGTLAGIPLADWLAAVGASPEEIWHKKIPPAERSLWDARVFPAVSTPQGYRDWLWMFDPAAATASKRNCSMKRTATAWPRSRCWPIWMPFTRDEPPTSPLPPGEG